MRRVVESASEKVMRWAHLIMNASLAIAMLTVAPFDASPQVSPKSLFAIHITKIKRVDEGCTAEAESSTVRFKISSELSAPCAMLRAGETYKAFRAISSNDPKDETKDSPILVIYNNVKNGRRENSVFAIESEEAIIRK